MDAEVILNYINWPRGDDYRNEVKDIDKALDEIGAAYDVETEHNPLIAHQVGGYGREVVLKGSERDVLDATSYLVHETREKGYSLPLNKAVDLFHPVAAWRGYRLSSYVLAKEKELDGHLDVAYTADDPEGMMDELGLYADELAERHGIEASAHERIVPYPVIAPAAALPPTTAGFYLSLDGDVNGIEGAAREIKERFADERPEYLGDPFHPIRSFRGKNVARAVELEERE